MRCGAAFGVGYLEHEDPTLTPEKHTGAGLAVSVDLTIQLRISRHFALGAFADVGFTARA